MKEYLRMEIKESELIKRPGFDNTVPELTKLWKEKYAVKRVEKFKTDGREFDFSTLFYDDLIRLTWEESKEKYLKDVGR